MQVLQLACLHAYSETFPAQYYYEPQIMIQP